VPAARQITVTHRHLLLLLSFTGIAAAQSAAITVVNGASYQSTLARDGFATIFGTGLANATAVATVDSDGNLPFALASTRVEVNGQPAPLFYVSPTQINFVVPSGAGAGAGTLVVSYTDNSSTRSANVTIASSAPALFSADQSGSGPGAIRNAVTFALAPFLVDTPESSFDPRTRLAVYGTGFRHASKVTARAGQQNLTVEYSGAAPGFFGLDQLNVILPASLDGAGAVSLTVTTEDGTSNAVTAAINLLPVSRLRLAGVSLSPTSVTGGDPVAATVSLNGIARTGGFPVSLRSTSVSLVAPGVVSIPEGQSSAIAQLTTTSVLNTQTGSVQATAIGVTVAADFRIEPTTQPQITSINVAPRTILGGRNVVGTVTLAAPAPGGGVDIQVASDNDAVRPPTTVRIPFNQLSATFMIPTVAVNGSVDVNLTATLGRSTASVKLTVLPVISFTVDTASIVGGLTIIGTITLGDPAPSGGASIAFTSSNIQIARPGELTIPAGSNTGTFQIATSRVTSPLNAVINASYQGVTRTLTVTILPQAAPSLESLTLSTLVANGGDSLQGTVKLTAAAGLGGQLVDLTSNGQLVAQVTPSFLTIPQGATTAQFTVNTFRVVTPQTVTITASSGGVSKSAILTVQ
jgi:uncharacterized protein (TIGR03437 family)